MKPIHLSPNDSRLICETGRKDIVIISKEVRSCNPNAGCKAEKCYEDKQVIQEVKYDTKRDITLRYMQVPVFIKYAFGTKTTKFRFLVGPQFSRLLEATQTYTRNGETLGTEAVNLDGKTFKTDAKKITDRFIKFDIGLVADVGADIHLSDKFFVSPGFRLNYGFKDINSEPYRMKDRDGEYSPSHNAWGGFYISINYKIDVEGYNQRSF